MLNVAVLAERELPMDHLETSSQRRTGRGSVREGHEPMASVSMAVWKNIHRPARIMRVPFCSVSTSACLQRASG